MGVVTHHVPRSGCSHRHSIPRSVITVRGDTHRHRREVGGTDGRAYPVAEWHLVLRPTTPPIPHPIRIDSAPPKQRG